MIRSNIAATMLVLSCGAASAATVDATNGALVFLADTAQVSVLANHGNGAANGVSEIFVAPDGDASNTPSADAQFAWVVNQAIAFAFSYDADGGFGGQGLLTATLGNASAIFGDVVGEVIARALTFNALSFTLVGPNANTESQFTLANLHVAGMAVSPGSFSSAGSLTNGFGVTGFGMVSDFSVTGTVTRTGTDLRGRPSLAMAMGNVTPALEVSPVTPVPVPAALPLLLLALGSLGLMARRRRS